MSTAQKERLQSALVDQIEEKNRMAEWWRRNASVRHGVPFDEGKRKVVVNVDEPQQQPIAVQPQPQPQPKESKMPDWAKWAAASLLPLGAAGAGYWLANREPVEPTPAIIEQDRSGSLYQYLEDHGYHLPDE